MIIAFTSNENTADSFISDRFGRANFFAFYDTTTKSFSFEENSSKNLTQGAGIKTAENIISKNPDLLVTSNLGPKAKDIFSSTDLKIILIEENITLKDFINTNNY